MGFNLAFKGLRIKEIPRTEKRTMKTKFGHPENRGSRFLQNRGSTVVKVLCYKSEGRWFDPSRRQWIFH